MIGAILGLIVSWTYVSTSWTGPYSQDSIFDALYWSTYYWMGGFLLLGIFIFPKTIGIMFTPAIFLLPFAFFISLFRHGFLYALSQFLIGLAGWFITLAVGRFRREAI